MLAAGEPTVLQQLQSATRHWCWPANKRQQGPGWDLDTLAHHTHLMEKSFVPVLLGLPIPAYQAGPRLRIAGIELMVSTLLMVVGQPAHSTPQGSAQDLRHIETHTSLLHGGARLFSLEGTLWTHPVHRLVGQLPR